MTPESPIKLVSELLDLAIIDSDGKYSGIVDDVEFEGTEALKLKALLVGPGAYEGRMQRWMFWVVRKIVGDRITRVPIGRARTIGTAVNLDCLGKELGLQQSEDRAERLIPRKGAF